MDRTDRLVCSHILHLASTRTVASDDPTSSSPCLHHVAHQLQHAEREKLALTYMNVGKVRYLRYLYEVVDGTGAHHIVDSVCKIW